MKRKIQIEGMSCGHCVSHVKEALEGMKGINEVQVKLDEKCAIVTGEASEELIKEVIDEAGYDVVGISNL